MQRHRLSSITGPHQSPTSSGRRSFSDGSRGDEQLIRQLPALEQSASIADHVGLWGAMVCQWAREMGAEPRFLSPALAKAQQPAHTDFSPTIWDWDADGVQGAASPLNEQIRPGNDPPPVWPWKKGAARGIAFHPLYPTVPEAAVRNPALEGFIDDWSTPEPITR